MDRKSRKKVRIYVIIYLVYFVLFSVFMFVLEKYEVVNNRQRMFGLIAAHPELEAEIIAAWEKPENDKDDNEQLKILKEIVFSSNFALRFYYVGKGRPKRLQYEYESDTMV